MGFPLPISIENIFLFLTLYKSPKKSRHSHHERMSRYRPGLVADRQVAGHPWDRACQLPLLHPPQTLAANSSSAMCQTAHGARRVGPDATFFPPSLLPAPCPPPEKPIFLCVRAPCLFCSRDSGPCTRRGMTSTQHCQHFASSLGQGPAHPTPTLHWDTLRGPTPACLTPAGTEVVWAHREGSQPRPGAGLGTHCGTVTRPSRSVPAPLLRCAGASGGRATEGLRSVHKAMHSHSFAGLAQEGRRWRLGNVIETPLPFEGVLELFSNDI